MSAEETDLRGHGLAEALRQISALFRQHALENAESEARMLLLGAAGLARSELILNPGRPLDPEDARRLGSFVNRRLAGEPATRILGARAFWTLDLRVTPDVLDPRPDSETIVSAALEALGPRRNEPFRVLDLGAGSGALLLAVLSECKNATGVGVDLSAQACAVARENAERNGLAGRAQILQGRWTDGLVDMFDLVVSNPPYIETDAIQALSVEVKSHDPRLALDGGADGLACYREIVAALPATLRPQGFAVLELGIGQGPAVASLAVTAGLRVWGSRKDLGGVERAMVFAHGA